MAILLWIIGVVIVWQFVKRVFGFKLRKMNLEANHVFENKFMPKVLQVIQNETYVFRLTDEMIESIITVHNFQGTDLGLDTKMIKSSDNKYAMLLQYNGDKWCIIADCVNRVVAIADAVAVKEKLHNFM
ncbi:hypothetical protein [Moraxella nonliquefaciens]|uniref:Uncharacterized protein n=1 Tax=Moraxella nonliquefaciens TaxID=478 RepID=A0A1B8QT66_MORNO|nr:hypothetical protein [Moraxella nonliquefaciens]OBX88386.1 hypothetical protein A7456_00545 [Moraxella nonliquefaciens]QPT44556.1 hypothetical protein I6G26_11095 [Moraxella nonliquefaciens]QQC29576.1 hypothetical protein I6H63_09875 [Moraxella nonliquefaciens]